MDTSETEVIAPITNTWYIYTFAHATVSSGGQSFSIGESESESIGVSQTDGDNQKKQV